MNEEIIEVVIGRGEDQAGFFKEHQDNKNIIVIVFRVNSPSSDDCKDSFERTLFISGVEYKAEEKEYDKVYIINCENIKHLERIIPAMEAVHEKRNMKSKIIISQDCYDFFGE